MKNNKFNTYDNESADKLLLMTENLSLLSDKIVIKIDNLVLWIVTNHKGHEKEIKSAINSLVDGLYYVSIFTPTFIENVKFFLDQALIHEQNKGN